MIDFLACANDLGLHVARLVRDVSPSLRASLCNYRNRGAETFGYGLSKLCMLLTSRPCLISPSCQKAISRESLISWVKKQSPDFLFSQSFALCFLLDKSAALHLLTETPSFLPLSFPSWLDSGASLRRGSTSVSSSNARKLVLQMDNSVAPHLVDSAV